MVWCAMWHFYVDAFNLSFLICALYFVCSLIYYAFHIFITFMCCKALHSFLGGFMSFVCEYICYPI